MAALVVMMGAGCAVQPDPLTDHQLNDSAQANLAEVSAQQEPVHGPISLYEAMARALKYNLDHRVEEAEAAVRVAELDLQHFSMLPKVVANSGYAGRDNYHASSSLNLSNNTLNFGSSTSQEKEIKSADIGFAWNVLDFGLSYVRAQQSADKYLIQTETRRRVMHRVVEDVRTAFWRAVSAERLLKRLQGLEANTRRVLRDTRQLYKQRDTSPITALTYERELVEIKQKIGEIERDLITSKAQLAALMNVPPDAEFSLAYASHRSRSLKLQANLDEMIWAALNNRPELREVEYKKRINRDEADAALLELLPGIQLVAGANFDSNGFLLNQHWLNWGAKASWNLIKVFSYRTKRNVIELQDEMLRQRALSLTMAIMTQVHVSRLRFYHARKELETAAEFNGVQKRLLAQVEAEASADRVSKQTLIRERMNGLVAQLKYDVAYARLQNAYANLFSSMGSDPYATTVDLSANVASLTDQLQQLWFERGDMNAGWQRKYAAK